MLWLPSAVPRVMTSDPEPPTMVSTSVTFAVLAELAKVGTEWYKGLHPADPSGGYGGKLGERDG